MSYLRYWWDMFRCAATGPTPYRLWMGWCTALMVAGGIAYLGQIEDGLAVTNLSDQVSWGAYIANFTFLVGVAAAAVLLVVPSYVYHRKDIKEFVLVGELMAAAAIVMCLLFVTVDLGRPDRVLHMMPGLGRLNFPSSILAWDVVVLSGYLVLNLHIPGYLLYARYRGKEPSRAAYLPFVLLSVGWAVSIHTVTAFLFSGFGGRPFWNTAVLAPRFLVSAFASGPALLIIVFAVIHHFSRTKVPESVFELLRRTVSFALPINFFLLGCEVFKEFYTDSLHVASAQYLFVGLHGHHRLVPYIWSGITMGAIAIVIFHVRRLYEDRRVLLLGSGLCVIGVWVEKGMGLVVPGFVPSPAGQVVEYSPSVTEFFISLGIWAAGAWLFTAMAKVALAIQRGDLHAPDRTDAND